ncbi:hypothetical protein ACMFMF_004074 [Clarireedia jacksonii]
MGKGILPDSDPLNTSTARSAALLGADVILILGARLNWILHYGEAPKYNPSLGKNNGDASLSIIGDINIVTSQLLSALKNWRYDTSTSKYIQTLYGSTLKNEAKAAKIDKIPMAYNRTFSIIKETIHKLSPPEDGRVICVSEGANTTDISRSVFPV